VVSAVVKAVETIRKGKVTNDVEGGKGEPASDINRLALRGAKIKFLDQLGDVMDNGGLLLVQGGFAEGRAQLPTLSAVVMAICLDYGHFVAGEEKPLELRELCFALSVGEYLGPGNGAINGNAVRGNAYNWPVLAV
jgi:hypothetical protein